VEKKKKKQHNFSLTGAECVVITCQDHERDVGGLLHGGGADRRGRHEGHQPPPRGAQHAGRRHSAHDLQRSVGLGHRLCNVRGRKGTTQRPLSARRTRERNAGRSHAASRSPWKT
jgi:hypothetical protein